MDEIERDDEDFTADHWYDEIGPQYADDHAEEITADFLSSGVTQAAITAHERHIVASKAQIEKAKQRLAEGDWDEVVFHAARALDGYLTQVFLIPFRERILEPFRAAFPSLPISDNTILRGITGLRSGENFIYVGVTATRDAKEAHALNDELHGLLSKDGCWAMRNRTIHTLENPTEQQARDFATQIEALLERLALPLDNEVKAAAERAAEAQRRHSVESLWCEE